MVGTRILFSGINLLARWHKESTVEIIFVGAYCLQGTVLRPLGTVLSLNPYLQPEEVGSRLTPLTEGETEGQRLASLPVSFSPSSRLLLTVGMPEDF